MGEFITVTIILVIGIKFIITWENSKDHIKYLRERVAWLESEYESLKWGIKKLQEKEEKEKEQ